ncbi:ATP-binding protein [Euzebya sp.]|uniref:sensor histidine kinase n=1 Tax=Euzebya sp. TaxID=1971409 RepID=UPI003511F8D9
MARSTTAHLEGAIAVDGSRAGHERNRYSRRLATAMTADEVLDALAVAITELLGGDEGFLLRHADGTWRGVLAAGAHREVAEALTVPDRAPLDVASAQTACTWARLGIRGRDVDAVVVPAGSAGDPGLLALVPDVVHPPPPGTPDGSGIDAAIVDHDLAVALASEAWAALRRVQAFDDLRDKLEILEAIAGVARAAHLDTDAVAAHIARHLATSLSCERGAVYLWDSARDDLGCAALHVADGTRHGNDDGAAAIARLVADGRPAVGPAPAEAAWLTGPWSAASGAVSVTALPLRLGDSDVGVLVAAHTTANPRGFTALCEQVGGAIAQQSALALSNARLYDAQRAAADRLRRIDQHRVDWVAGIVHDLRTPVTAVLGFARTLRRAEGLMTEEERGDALETIERQSLRVSRMLDDLMDSARADAGQLAHDRFGRVTLHQVVADAVQVTSPEDRRRITVDVDDEVVVEGDAEQLTRVVQNLVVNALRHAGGSDPITVDVRADGGRGVVRVADAGRGMPADMAVFDRFARGEGGGTGLGLFTVKRIVEMHGGTVELSTTPGGGTTVEVRLPLLST